MLTRAAFGANPNAQQQVAAGLPQQLLQEQRSNQQGFGLHVGCQLSQEYQQFVQWQEKERQQQVQQQQLQESSVDLPEGEPPTKKGPGRPPKAKSHPRARKQPANQSDGPRQANRSWGDNETTNLLECWFYRKSDFKVAGKCGPKLTQIWQGVYGKLCELMPDVASDFNVPLSPWKR
ncbi:hypothetical protein ABBQ32_008836 [Trebouxia sp. C0010 RCD-2024]